MGRSTKLNPDTQEIIIEAISSGNYQETAAALAGIEERTFYNWMKRGENEAKRLEQNPRLRPQQSEKIYLQFFQAVKKALASSEARDIAVVDQAAQGGVLVAKKTVTKRTESKNGAVTETTIEEESYLPPQWQAAAWRLERKFPDKFGKKDKSHVELTGRDGGPIQIDAKAELISRISGLVARAAETGDPGEPDRG